MIQGASFWVPLPDPVTATSSNTIAMNTSPSGNLIVGWVDTGGTIRSSLFNFDTNTWSTPIVISTATATFSNLCIAINDTGDCAAAWIDATNSVIECSYKPNSSPTWGAVYTQSTGMTVYPIYYPPNLTIDNSGIAVVAWTQSGSGSDPGLRECYVFAVACVNQVWDGMGNPILSSNRARFNGSGAFNAPEYPGIVLGNPSGDIIVLWSGGFEVMSDSFKLLYALRNNDGSWTSPVVLTPTGGTAAGAISGTIHSTLISVAVDATVGFTTSDLQPTLSGDWAIESLPFPSNITTSSLASVSTMNSSGLRTVVFFSRNLSGGSIYASSSAPSSNTWSAAQKLNTGYYNTFTPISAVLDSANLSIAAWYDGTNIEYSYAQDLEPWVEAQTLSATSSKQTVATTNTGFSYVAWVANGGDLKVSVHRVVPTPGNATGTRWIENFGVQQELWHQLNWSAPEPFATYLIYSDADLTNLIASTSNLSIDFHNRSPDLLYTYYLVALDRLGNTSNPALITIYR